MPSPLSYAVCNATAVFGAPVARQTPWREGTLHPCTAIWAVAIAIAGGLGISSSALAEQKDRKPRTLAEQLIHDVKEGKVQRNDQDEGAVQELIVKRNIPITYQY